MKRPLHVLFTACAALAWCPGAVPQVAAEESGVLAQDLQQLTAPGKVTTVIWTRRSDLCTLQLVLPIRSNGLSSLDPPFGDRVLTLVDQRPELQRTIRQVQEQTVPQVQVWLLRADGTLIIPVRRSIPGSSPRGIVPIEILYSFPLTAGKEAVAAAVSIDGDFHIEKLAPFGP